MVARRLIHSTIMPWMRVCTPLPLGSRRSLEEVGRSC